MMPFVGVALHAAEMMEMHDKASQGILMRFCKIYPPEKIGRIIEKAKTYVWWQNNPKAAFMKAVGEVNRLEKACQTKTESPTTV